MFSCEFFYIQNTSERLLLILLRRLLYIFHCQKFPPQKKSLCAKISTSGKPAYCGSPFSERESRDCKIRSLSMRSISCSTCIYFICATEEKFYQLEVFFQSLANDDVSVNKTQKISTKIHAELLSGF